MDEDRVRSKQVYRERKQLEKKAPFCPRLGGTVQLRSKKKIWERKKAAGNEIGGFAMVEGRRG